MVPLCLVSHSREDSSVAPTLENDVRKVQEDGDAFYALIQATHRGVTSLGMKLADFRQETAENFAGFRQETAENFAGFRQGTAENFAGVRKETAENFAGVRKEMLDFRKETLDEFAEVRATLSDVRADTVRLSNDMRRQELRMTKFNGRLDRLEGKADKQSKQLDLIIRHMGIKPE
jgi:hypothetical protein